MTSNSTTGRTYICSKCGATKTEPLINYLVEMSQKARECLWDNKLFGIHGSPE